MRLVLRNWLWNPIDTLHYSRKLLLDLFLHQALCCWQALCTIPRDFYTGSAFVYRGLEEQYALLLLSKEQTSFCKKYLFHYPSKLFDEALMAILFLALQQPSAHYPPLLLLLELLQQLYNSVSLKFRAKLLFHWIVWYR